MYLLSTLDRALNSKPIGTYALIHLSVVAGLIFATAANVGGSMVSEYLTAGFEEPLESDSDEQTGDEEISELFFESNGRARRPERGVAVAPDRRGRDAPEGWLPMIETIDAWLRLAAARLHDQAPALTALDQAIGDGDHGTNMDRGFRAIVASLDAGSAEGDDDRSRAAARLRTAGRTLISTVGGAAGPLYGTAFMRASGALAAGDGTGSSSELALTALEAGIGGISALGKSTTGEKTMLDALVPAAEAGRAAIAAGSDWTVVADSMAAAAEEGMAATIPLLATKGRASYLGERSIGHQDPGATSSALLIRALADVSAGR